MKDIQLTQGKVALVDDADYDAVRQFNWCAQENKRKFGSLWYAKRNAPDGQTRMLHRFILRPPVGVVVDHLDDNGLNCQRSNMKLRTNADNIRRQLHKPGRGSSRFKGVSFDRSRNKWAASAMVNRKHVFLGRFDSEEEAGAARAAFDAKAVTA